MQDQVLFWGGLIFTAVFLVLGLIFLAVWLLRWKNLQFELEREYGKKKK